MGTSCQSQLLSANLYNYAAESNVSSSIFRQIYRAKRTMKVRSFHPLSRASSSFDSRRVPFSQKVKRISAFCPNMIKSCLAVSLPKLIDSNTSVECERNDGLNNDVHEAAESVDVEIRETRTLVSSNSRLYIPQSFSTSRIGPSLGQFFKKIFSFLQPCLFKKSQLLLHLF